MIIWPSCITTKKYHIQVLNLTQRPAGSSLEAAMLASKTVTGKIPFLRGQALRLCALGPEIRGDLICNS